MKNRPRTQKKRTPTEQARHDRSVMSGLLVVIAVLLTLVIALLPDGRSDGRPTADESVRRGADSSVDSGGGVPDRVAEEENGEATGRQTEGPVTEIYPEDETPPASQQPDREGLWWLPTPDPAVTPGALYVVLDDAGASLEELEPFLALDLPLTIAILPRLAFSAESALLSVTAGQEVILHQPMEPLGGGDPGPGAITASTAPEAIAAVVRENLVSVPGAIGMNNHMGSLITQDERQMRAVLETLRETDLFFLDSRTSSGTVAGRVAGMLELPFVERHVFLDNDRDRESMLTAFRGGFERARSGEDTILIGHVTVPELASVLAEVAAAAREHGYRFGHLSQAIETATRVFIGAEQ